MYRVESAGRRRANERLHVSLAWQYVFDKSCKSTRVAAQSPQGRTKHALMEGSSKAAQGGVRDAETSDGAEGQRERTACASGGRKEEKKGFDYRENNCRKHARYSERR